MNGYRRDAPIDSIRGVCGMCAVRVGVMDDTKMMGCRMGVVVMDLSLDSRNGESHILPYCRLSVSFSVLATRLEPGANR